LPLLAAVAPLLSCEEGRARPLLACCAADAKDRCLERLAQITPPENARAAADCCAAAAERGRMLAKVR
jgi:hypothetical protein